MDFLHMHTILLYTYPNIMMWFFYGWCRRQSRKGNASLGGTHPEPSGFPRQSCPRGSTASSYPGPLGEGPAGRVPGPMGRTAGPRDSSLPYGASHGHGKHPCPHPRLSVMKKKPPEREFRPGAAQTGLH